MAIVDNKVIRNLLNLKEDYLLDLDKLKNDDEIDLSKGKREVIKEDDGEEEEDNDGETSSEKDDDKKKPQPQPQQQQQQKKEEPSKPAKPVKPAEPAKQKPVDQSPKFKVDLSALYTDMKKAATPSDVAKSLSKFLKCLQTTSLETLTSLVDSAKDNTTAATTTSSKEGDSEKADSDNNDDSE